MPANDRPAFRPSGESRQHTAAAGAAGETFARLPARRDGRNSVWNLAPGDVGQADADARTFLHLAKPKPAPRAPRTLAQAKLDRAMADQIAEAAAAPVVSLKSMCGVRPSPSALERSLSRAGGGARRWSGRDDDWSEEEPRSPASTASNGAPSKKRPMSAPRQDGSLNSWWLQWFDQSDASNHTTLEPQ